MICPDCKKEIDDDADVCPSCGMFILDEEPEYAPRIFSIGAVVFGLTTFGLAIVSLLSHTLPLDLWLFELVASVIGLLLGRKGRQSTIPRVASMGVMLNGTALVLGLLACFG